MKIYRILGCLAAAASVAVLSVTASGYKVQKGYVKTRGRLAANGSVIPGKRIPGAVIQLLGGTSQKSVANGDFSINVPSQNFHLKNVSKPGYVVSDPDILSKRYAWSANPLVLVLETPQQQADDRLATEKKLRRDTQRKLEAKEDELQALKEEKRISDEEYRQKLQELYKLQETNEKFISEMADRYSRIDFDELDDFHRRMATFIQNGELTRADSLLNTKGSMDEREAEINRLRESNRQREDEIAKEQKELENSKSLEALKLSDFGADCYHRFEMCKLDLKNDSAAYWLERRAKADPTNIDWQLEAGNFIRDYLADYDNSLQYNQTALERAKEINDSENEANALNNIGSVYDSMGNYPEALEYHEKALKIRLDVLGENHPDVATSYNNIGSAYYSMGNYPEALEYYEKALKIRLDVLGENHPDVATSYNNIGSVYDSMGNYPEALEYHEKALKIRLDVLDENHPDVATSYNNIGSVYDSMGKYPEALEYHEKALKIRLDILCENHPDVATSYNNIGSVYYSMGKYPKVLEYLEKALKVQLDVLDENHPHVATSYNNIGSVYYDMGNYPKALEYLEKSLKITLKIFGEDHPSVKTIKENIDFIKEPMNGAGDE